MYIVEAELICIITRPRTEVIVHRSKYYRCTHVRFNRSSLTTGNFFIFQSSIVPCYYFLSITIHIKRSCLAKSAGFSHSLLPFTRTPFYRKQMLVDEKNGTSTRNLNSQSIRDARKFKLLNRNWTCKYFRSNNGVNALCPIKLTHQISNSGYQSRL